MKQKLCDQVQDYVDGELSAAESERFRDHLRQCEDCQRTFESALQFAVLGYMAGQGRPPEKAEQPRTARVRRPVFAVPAWKLWTFSGSVLAAGITLFFVLAHRNVSPPARPGAAGELHDELAQWLEQSPTRAIEARLSLAPAWRRYATTNSASASAGAAETGVPARLDPIEIAASLKHREDWARLATLYLARGKADEARSYLDRLPSTAESENDRGVADLLRGHDDEALTHLNRALAIKSDFPPAQWNRGLALQRLRMPLSALQAFRAASRGSAQPWQDEAAEHIQRIEGEINPQRTAWAAITGAKAGIARGEMPSDDLFRDHPDIVRHLLYQALRGATSPEAARKLRPIAQRLDALDGQSLLTGYADRVARERFATRSRIAGLYGTAITAPDPEAAMERIVDEARRSAPPDILIGVLEQAKATPARAAEITRLVAQTKDPWLARVAEYKQIEALVESGRLREAQERLVQARASCDARTMAFRCLFLSRKLTDVHYRQYQPERARAVASETLEEATHARLWKFTKWATEDLAATRSQQQQFALAEAYIEEAGRQRGESCTVARWAALQTSQLRMAEHRPADARRSLASAPACDHPLDLAAAEVWSDLARLGAVAADIAHGRAVVQENRAAGLDEVMQAHADAVEGRLVIGQDRATGARLLDAAIAKIDQMREPSAQARETRAMAFATLIDQRVLDRDFDGALAAFNREIGASRAGRCVVALSRDVGASVVVAAGDDGIAVGDRRTFEGDPPAEQSLVKPLLPRFERCELVDVIARAPILGQANILPARFTWRYLMGAPASKAATDGTGRVVIANAATPPRLELPPVPGPPSTDAPGPIAWLEHGRATPDAVLRAAEHARVVEIYAHGSIDPNVSDTAHIVLAPGTTGGFELTARDIAAHRFASAPIVFIAACRAATTSGTRRSTSSLPAAFIRAGARAVFASPDDLRSDQVGPLFDRIRRAMEAGKTAAVALREARSESPGDSSQSIVLFE